MRTVIYQDKTSLSKRYFLFKEDHFYPISCQKAEDKMFLTREKKKKKNKKRHRKGCWKGEM